MRPLAIALAFLSVPLSGMTHHSRVGVFDFEAVVEVEGTLGRVFWRNPHVRVWLEDDEGETWEIEMVALRGLEGRGITRDLFVEGEVFRFAGYPGIGEDHSIFGTNTLFPDGREALIGANVAARWSDRFFGSEMQPRIVEANVREDRERANGLFRVWSSPTGPELDEDVEIAYSDTALAAKARYGPQRDDPVLRCIASGMVIAMTGPYPMELVKDGEDITIRLEEWDQTRRVHMSGDRDPTTVAPSPLGYSEGRWEGSTLVVSTSRIRWPYLDRNGGPQSGDVRMVERFSMNEDEDRLNWEVEIVDPGTLLESVVFNREYQWVPGVRIEPYNCTLAEIG